MENALTNQENELVELEGIKITRSQIELVKRTIFIGATDDEFRLFFYECRRRGVHPMDRLIYPVVRKDKEGNRHIAFQMSIDYLRAAGEETARYVGQKPMNYGSPIKQKTDEGDVEVPEWAEAIVLRKDSETGEIVEIPHRTRWVEYYPGQKLGHMWRKMPYGQLGKCAEAGALRKAFPRKLGGLYINEEMEQAEAIPFTPIQMPQQKKNGSTAQDQPSHPPVLISTIKEVTEKKGVTKGTAWTIYMIYAGEDKFSTFDKKIAEQAKTFSLSKTICQLTYETDAKGNRLTEIVEYIEREPGEEGQ